MLYDTKCQAAKKKHIHKMGVIEMRMLKWISGNTMKDMIQNKEIHLKIGVASIDEKMSVLWDGLVIFKWEWLM